MTCNHSFCLLWVNFVNFGMKLLSPFTNQHKLLYNAWIMDILQPLSHNRPFWCNIYFSTSNVHTQYTRSAFIYIVTAYTLDRLHSDGDLLKTPVEGLGFVVEGVWRFDFFLKLSLRYSLSVSRGWRCQWAWADAFILTLFFIKVEELTHSFWR